MPRILLQISSCVLVLVAHLSCGRLRESGGPGTVQLPLQATSPAGNTYQLRNATFQLTGPTTATLTTGAGADPSAALLVPLRTGTYSAQLLSGWTLVRLLPGGASQAVQAQLVSANPTTFAIVSQQETTVGFAFETDGDVVDTSMGTGRIVLTVRERDGGGADTTPGPMCSPPRGPCARNGGTCCAGGFCLLGGGIDGDICVACVQLQQACASNEQCCSGSCVGGRCTDGSCSQVGGFCGRNGGSCCASEFCATTAELGDTCQACKPLQQVCSANEECCTSSCVLGKCTDGACSTADGPCARNGGTCCPGTFCALGGGRDGDVCLTCRQLQQTCAGDVQCCGNSCVGGRCVAAAVVAPTFVAAGAGVDGTTSLAVPFPAGLQANDLLVLQVGSRTPATTPATPPGAFTTLDTGEGANPNAYQRLYYRFASGAESGSLALTLDAASNVAAGRLYAFRGVAPSAFIEGTATSEDDDGTLPGPTVVTAASGRLAVAFVALDNNAPMAPFVGETGGDWAEPVPEFATGLGSNFALQVQIAPLPAGGGTISGGEANFGGAADASFCRAFALVGR